MDYGWFLALLALLTLGIVIVFALRSKRQTNKRERDPNAPKSSLARDGDPHRKAD